MALSRQGERKLKEWIDLLTRDGWSKPDKQFLVDYWLEHHDEDGKFLSRDAAARDGSKEGE